MRALLILVLCLAACDPERSGYDDDILTINEEEAPIDDIQTVDDNGNGGGALDLEEETVGDIENEATDIEADADEDNDGILDEDDPDFGLFEE